MYVCVNGGECVCVRVGYFLFMIFNHFRFKQEPHAYSYTCWENISVYSYNSNMNEDDGDDDVRPSFLPSFIPWIRPSLST